MIRKVLACYLVLAIFVIGMVPQVEAAFSPSDLLTIDHSARTGDVEKIRAVLENKLVSQRLQDLGYSADEITGKLAQLSDQEVHKIAQKLDDLKVGGDGLEVLLIVLIIIVLVIVILNLTGHKVLVK